MAHGTRAGFHGGRSSHTAPSLSSSSNSKMSSDNHPDSPLEACELVTQVKLLLSFEVWFLFQNIYQGNLFLQKFALNNCYRNRTRLFILDPISIVKWKSESCSCNNNSMQIFGEKDFLDRYFGKEIKLQMIAAILLVSQAHKLLKESLGDCLRTFLSCWWQRWCGMWWARPPWILALVPRAMGEPLSLTLPPPSPSQPPTLLTNWIVLAISFMFWDKIKELRSFY